MTHPRTATSLIFSSLLAAACSSSDPGPVVSSSGGTLPAGGAVGQGGAIDQGGTVSSPGGAQSNGGSNLSSGGTTAQQGGAVNQGGSPSNGGAVNGGSTAAGGKASGGTANGGTSASAGGAKAGGAGGTSGGATAVGGKASGGTSAGGSAAGGKASGGTASGGTTGSGNYACPGTPANYNVTMIKSGSTWTVMKGSTQVSSGTDTAEQLGKAYGALNTSRTSKESILVQGDGDIPADAQLSIPSYTVLNWCGTLNVSGTPTQSDRSPLYARGKTDVEIPNLKMTGAPMYGIFFRGTSNMILGNIDLRLSGGSPGIGIRVDTSGSAGTDTTFVKNLQINYVYGTGMSSHVVETYGVDGIKIGTVEGQDVGECGLLFNRSINAEVELVQCTNCGAGTGYAAFRVANNNGMVGSSYPAGNIHVKKVSARAGGRGIFSVSKSGGLTIDLIDLANTGSTPILLQNCYNTTIAATSGTVVGGEIRISNDKTNTEKTTDPFPPTRNTIIQNLTLSGGAYVLEDWCDWNSQGDVGNRAINVTGGTVDMCY